MRKNIIWISLFSFAMTTIAESSIASVNTGIFPLLAKNRKKAEPKDSVASDYKKLTGRDSVALKGIANIIKKNGSFYLEFPTRLLGREFLVTNRLQKVPLELNEAGVNKGINYENQVVTFEWQREGKKLCIRQQRLTPEVPVTDALASSVADNYINPLIASLKIEAVAPDSSTVVIKIDELFNGKQTGLNDVFNNINLGTSANADLSRILDIKAFESNITATSELTTIVREGMSKVNVTVVVSSSLSLLPETPMRGRKESRKVGYFTSHRLSYSDRQQELETRHYITRWRLEPTDEAAYLRGELTSPKKPITFYIDPATPKQLRPYIRKGILDWNTAFEQAGFKDAIRVEEYTDSMAAEGDDLKYSLFTYAASEKSNAMGPSVIDPRTGEIIEADIIWWHNVVSLLREWIVIQTGAVNPAVRNPELPDSLMGDAARFVACHEVGHSLGLKHNMIASWAYPTDSLRSPGFMSRVGGTASSIMDYARFNYVAQPGDKERGVKLTPPRFGEYDKYLIKWTYTPVFNVNSAEEEAIITGKWISDAIKENPVYRYGKQQVYGVVDPRSQTEDIGDNSMKATRYGIKNLKYIMNNLESWISEGDDTYEYREDLFIGIVEQLAMYVTHVAGNVGGYFVNEVKEGDTMPRFVQIPKAQQKEALNYLFEIYNDLDWLDNKNLLTKFPVSGSPKQTIQNFMLRYILPVPFQVSQYEGLEKDSFTAAEAFNMIYNFVWKPTISGHTLTESQMNLQKQYIYMMMQTAGFTIKGAGKALAGEKLLDINHRQFGYTCCQGHALKENAMHNPIAGFEWKPLNRFSMTAKVTQADVYAYIAKAKQLMKQKAASASGKTKAHYELLLKMLDINLK